MEATLKTIQTLSVFFSDRLRKMEHNIRYMILQKHYTEWVNKWVKFKLGSLFSLSPSSPDQPLDKDGIESTLSIKHLLTPRPAWRVVQRSFEPEGRWGDRGAQTGDIAAAQVSQKIVDCHVDPKIEILKRGNCVTSFSFSLSFFLFLSRSLALFLSIYSLNLP